ERRSRRAGGYGQNLARSALPTTTKAAEDSRTPKAGAYSTVPRHSARFWSAAVLCRFSSVRWQALTDRSKIENQKLIRASILRHVVINLLRPRVDASLYALEVFEALLAQELQRLHRAHPALAVDVVLVVWVQLRE